MLQSLFVDPTGDDIEKLDDLEFVDVPLPLTSRQSVDSVITEGVAQK